MGDTVVLLAPTGKAAVNIDGQTLHRFLYLPTTKIKRRNIAMSSHKAQELEAKLHNIKYIIIDEMSMTGRRMLGN